MCTAKYQVIPRDQWVPQQGGGTSNPGVAAVLSLVIPGAGQMYRGNLGTGFGWLFAVVMGYLFLVPVGVVLHIVCVVGAASR